MPTDNLAQLQELQLFSAIKTQLTNHSFSQKYPSFQQAVRGSLGSAVAHQLDSGGKRLRALLAVKAGIATEVDDHSIRQIALCSELLHQASLVHDDLQDRDIQRGNGPAVWAQYSDATAICTGDTLLMEAFQQLSMLEHGNLMHIPALMHSATQMVQYTCEGQARDCAFSANAGDGGGITLADYEYIVSRKSGPLLAFPVMAMAILNGYQRSILDRILLAGFDIGLAYQLGDDFVDRDTDYGARLNGYWLHRQDGGDERSHQQATDSLDKHLHAHLNAARQHLLFLPVQLRPALDYLIESIGNKFDDLEAVA